MTQTEKRIQACEKRIEKLNNSTKRLELLISKKKQRIASGKEENNKYINGKYLLQGEIEWHEEDIKCNQKDLEKDKILLEELKAKRQKEVEKENELFQVECEAINNFLEDWKQKAKDYYIKQANKYHELREEHKRIDEEIENKDISYIERNRLSIEEHKRFKEVVNTCINSLATDLYKLRINENGNHIDEIKLEVIIEREKQAKKRDLYERINKVVGKIKDATMLTIGERYGEINGIIIGESGKAEIETISAGGYNIQCYHYRVLIKKLG